MKANPPAQERDARLLTRFAWALCAAALLCLPLAWVHHELGALRSWQLLLHPLLFLALALRRFRPLDAYGPSHRLLLTSAAVALVWILFAQGMKYFAFAINGVDFSIFDWMLHNTLHGRFMYSPIYDVNHFGVHPSYWMLLLVPLHALWPSPLMLSAITGLVVWGACLPLWHLVHGRTRSGWMAWLACVAYLTCAWTGRIIDGGFRPEVLYPLAGFTLLLAWERQRWVLPAALLLLSVKEDAALYLAGFSLAVLVSQRQRWRGGLGLLVLALAVFGLNVGVVQPAALASTGRARPEYMTFWSDYGGTMSEVVRFMLGHPLRVAGDVLQSGWLKLLGPLLLLPLASPRALGMMLPGLVLLGAATYPLMHDFGTYYPIPLLAPALWGAVEVCTSPRVARHQGLARALLATVLLAFPLFWVGYVKLPLPRFALHRELAALESAPSGPSAPGPLCAQTVLFPHLSYALQPTPLFWTQCLDQPGAWALVHLELDPYPLKRSDLEGLVTRAQALGHARPLPEGTWILVGPNRR
jgi:hypothetical protein